MIKKYFITPGNVKYFFKQCINCSLVSALLLLLPVSHVISATYYNCSSSAGDAVINEVYNLGSNRFVEIAFLQDNVDVNTWQLCYSKNLNNNGVTCVDLSGVYNRGDYLVIDANNDLNIADSEVFLVSDESGSVWWHDYKAIDYLRFGSGDVCEDDGSYRWAVTGSCGSCLNTHSPDSKDLARLPDGTGDWYDNGDNETRGATNGGTPVFPSPVADYHLDECQWEGGSVYDVADSSGNNLNGYAILPPVSVDVRGEQGGVCQAASMGGVSHLAVPDNDLLDIPNNLTAMAWIKPGSYPSSGIKSILSKDENYEFHIDTQGRVYWWWRWDGVSGDPKMTTSATVPVGSWSHITVRFTNGVSTIFINGVQVMQSTWNPSYRLDVNNDILQIGGDFIGTRYFDGGLDEILIFDQALSDSQIAEIYSSQLAGKNYDGTERLCVDCEDMSDTVVLSFDWSGSIGSPTLNFDPSDLLIYKPVTREATFLRRLSDEFIYNSGYNSVTAAHIDQDGNIYFSPSQSGTLPSGMSVDADDILKLDIQSGTVDRVFDGDGYFSSADENIDAFYLFESSGKFLISTESGFSFQGSSIYYESRDLVLFNPDNPAGSAELYFDGSQHFTSNGNINGVHIINDEQLLLTTSDNSALGSFQFRWTDVVRYATIPKVGVLYLDGVTECNGSWIDIDSITTADTSVAIDHYEIVHDGAALSCAAEEVTLVACENSDCSAQYSGSVTVTMTPTGWIGGDNVTFTGSGTAEIRNNSGGTITLGLSAQTVAPADGYRCVETVGGAAVSCDLVFSDAGFDFTIPTQTSCKTSDTLIISAVKKDDVTEKCVPAFSNRTVDIPFYSTYVSPATGSGSVRVNGSAVSTSSPGTDIALDFDVNGDAEFTVSYADAGQLQLDTIFVGTGDEDGLIMTGNESFVVHPAGLCIYSDQSGSDCVSGDANCTSFVAAGTEFTLKVKGVCWEDDSETDTDFCDTNTITPNYQQTGIALSHSLVAPLTGTAGSIEVESADIASGGEVSLDQIVSEVGVFTFTADPPDDYLGASDVFNGADFTSANIGRFIPAYLDVSILPDPPAYNNQCNGLFTYLGEPFFWDNIPEVTIRAMNGANPAEVTTNYEGDFFKLDPTIDYGYQDTLAVATVLPLTPVSAQKVLTNLSDTNGVVVFDLEENAGFNYTRPDPYNPISPFDINVQFTIPQEEITDSDAVCYDSSGCAAFTVEDITGVTIRHGRTKIFDNYGPELEDIEFSPFSVQYYNGTSFITNEDDDCTTAIGFDSARASASSVPEVSTGEGFLTVTADGTASRIQVNCILPTWLSCPSNSECSGWFTFGISRGNDRIINWKEISR